jgi:hypothetical protein
MRWVGHVVPIRERKGLYSVWWEKLSEGEHLIDPGVEAKIILRWIFRKWNGGVDKIDLAQDRDMWRALVSAVMNLCVTQNSENFLTS